MKGYQITFYTQQDRKHGALPLGEWLLQEARKLGVQGATLSAANEGFGRHGKLHSAGFFELADQPIRVILALSEEEVERLFAHLREEKVDVFYVKTPIEYGMTLTE